MFSATLAGLATAQKTVKLYFKAQLLYALVVFIAAPFFGIHDATYALIYAAVTLPILECCCFLIWEERLSEKLYLASVSFGLFVGIIAASGMPRHPVEDYVTFGEGVILAIIGIAMRFASAKLAIRTIGALSLALSCYDFAYLRNESWAELNTWLPAALCTVAFWRIALSKGGDRALNATA